MTALAYEPTVPSWTYLSWKSQLVQYDARGPRGISYFAAEVDDNPHPIDCLLYRCKAGKLRAILNYYGVDYPPYEKAGNVNLWVAPRWQRRGIGMRLLEEADRRWQIDFDQQRYTEAGAALITAFLRRRGDRT